MNFVPYCNVLLARRLEHTAIGTLAGHQRVVQEQRRQRQRLPRPQGHIHFEIAARIDTQPDLVVKEHRDRMER
jgi:hypothetical protein